MSITDLDAHMDPEIDFLILWQSKVPGRASFYYQTHPDQKSEVEEVQQGVGRRQKEEGRGPWTLEPQKRGRLV